MIATGPATTETGLEEGRVQAKDHTMNNEAIFWLSGETDFNVTIFMARERIVSCRRDLESIS